MFGAEFLQAIFPDHSFPEGVLFGGVWRNPIGFPLHARKFSAGILNSQQTILSRPKQALGSDKLAREAPEAVSEAAIIMHYGAADDIYK